MKLQVFIATALATAFLAITNVASAAPIFADSLIGTTGNTTPFGSGNVTGSPDGGGIFLGNPPTVGSSITVGFAMPFYDGPGNDIRVFDIEGFSPDPNELADVFVSNDGITFTLVGSITGGNAAGFVDINGAFAGPASFIRVTQSGGNDALDIDAIQAINMAPVPEPASIAIWSALGAAGFFGARRRRKTQA